MRIAVKLVRIWSRSFGCHRSVISAFNCADTFKNSKTCLCGPFLRVCRFLFELILSSVMATAATSPDATPKVFTGKPEDMMPQHQLPRAAGGLRRPTRKQRRQKPTASSDQDSSSTDSSEPEDDSWTRWEGLRYPCTFAVSVDRRHPLTSAQLCCAVAKPCSLALHTDTLTHWEHVMTTTSAGMQCANCTQAVQAVCSCKSV